MQSFTQKLITKNQHRFCYIKAIASDGKKAWYFVLIKPNKFDSFKKLDPKKGYRITDYADIVESGYGDQPSDEVMAKINREYKCDFA